MAPRTTHKRVKRAELPARYHDVGEVFVVGSGDCGQLGLGPEVLERESPKRIDYFNDKNIVMVFAGGMHNIALSASGQLFSWGCNDQMALGRSGEETEPAPVEGLTDEVIVDVALGDSISVALTNKGRVYAWGTFRNASGIFGYGTGVDTQAKPKLVIELKEIVSIACGSNHVVAVSSEGKIYSWGVGEQGQLGRKIMERHSHESSLRPRVINFRPGGRMSTRFTHAFCGSYHTFLVHESNTVYACGLNNYGQLGIGHFQEHEFEPEEVEGLQLDNGIIRIAGGEHHSMILDAKGQVYTFGRGDCGQLGLGSTENQNVPTHIKSLSTVKWISCGASFSLAVTQKEGNNLWMWGYGEMGQLSNGSEDADVPENTELKGREVIAAAAGGQHTVMLLKPKVQ